MNKKQRKATPGEFNYNLSPEQAEAEIQAILRDPKHPYNNDKASPQEHQAAIDWVNHCYMIKTRE